MRIGAKIFLVATLCFSAATSLAQYRVGETFRDCKTCPDMVVIPPGTFTMGSERGEQVFTDLRPESPVHQRQIRRAFAMGQTEVTNAQFGTFVKETGYRPSQACTKWRGEVVMFGGNWTDPDYGRAPQDEEPVVCVLARC